MHEPAAAAGRRRRRADRGAPPRRGRLARGGRGPPPLGHRPGGRPPAQRARPLAGRSRPAAGRGRRRPPPGPLTRRPCTTAGYLDGVRAGAPIGVAAFAFGVSFGVLARSAGMGRLAPVVMSLTTFGGSAQFAAASILGAGGGVATAVIAAVLLKLRYG